MNPVFVDEFLGGGQDLGSVIYRWSAHGFNVERSFSPVKHHQVISSIKGARPSGTWNEFLGGLSV